MRTTLDLDPELLAAAMKAAGTRTKTAAVTLGLETLVQKAARERLAALRGQMPDAAVAPRRRASPES